MKEFFLLDAEAINSKESIQVRLFGRTRDNRMICAIDKNFYPYFWAICKNKNAASKASKRLTSFVLEDDVIYRVKRTKVSKKNFWGKECYALKVEVKSQKAISEFARIAKGLPEIFAVAEADIKPAARYLIDSGIDFLSKCEAKGKVIQKFGKWEVTELESIAPSKENLDKFNILAFDIETYNNGIAYSNVDKDAIISLAFSGGNFQKVITWKKFKTNDKSICFVNNEKELIEEFVKTIRDYYPDFLVGYFSDSFDLPYIIKRGQKYKVKIDIGFGKAELRRRGSESTVRIPGVVHIDLLRFIRHIMGYSLSTQSYDLDSVAKEIVGSGKTEEFDVKKIGLAWDSGGKGVEQICDYNLNDAMITRLLGNKIIPNIIEISRIISQPIFDVSRMTYGQMVEWFLIKKAPEHKELCPNRPGYDRIASRMEDTYQGAFVYNPTAGLYEKIAVLDFKSLYPTVIVAHNIGPTTLTKNKTGIKSPPIQTNRKTVHYFFKKTIGLIPSSIREIILARNQLKELYKKKKDPLLAARIYGLKTIANAAYGYLGFPGSRWYCKECAESITAFSREYIQKTINKAKGSGFEVIYGDTDSIFLNLKNKNKNDVLEFLSKINKQLPEIMELELEGFFERGLFVTKRKGVQGAKKKYALIDSQGIIKIVGFESIRGDWSRLAKKVQRRVISIILKENSPKKALNYVKKIVENLKNKKVAFEELIIQTQLKKKIDEYRQIGPHVAVAKRMKQAGLPVSRGSIISYIVEQGSGKIRDRARIPEEAREYDSDYYINNQIIPAVEGIFEVLGFKKKDLLGGSEQISLGGFIKK